MFKFPKPFWAPEDGTGAGAADGGADAAAAAAAAASAAAAAVGSSQPWYKGSDFSDEEQAWLAARGLTEDDPTKVVPKLVKGHRAAEQRLGRGIDTILDKPADGQKPSEWLAANRAALGLPDKEEGYAVQKPEFWPKDAVWNADLEASARKIAFDNGVPPEAFQGFVTLYAQAMADMETASKTGLETATAQMMTELKRDWGQQTDARVTQAKQAAEVIAQKAGLTPDHMTALSQVMSDKTGDATVIRFMAAIGEMLGEDAGIGIGKGGSMTMTPVEARAQLAAFTAEGGEWAKASAEGNAAKIAELRPRFATLAKLAAG